MTDFPYVSLGKTAEGLFRLEAAPSEEGLPVEFLSRRLTFIKQAILHLIQQMRERRVLSDKTLERLNEEQCTLSTKRFELPSFGLGYNTDLDKIRLEIDREIERLEIEKFKETTAYWKDLAQLKRDLIDYVREYHTLVEKLEVLTGKEYPRPSFDELLALVDKTHQKETADTETSPSAFQLAQLRRIP